MILFTCLAQMTSFLRLYKVVSIEYLNLKYKENIRRSGRRQKEGWHPYVSVRNSAPAVMLDRGLASTTYYSATSSFSRKESIVRFNPISRPDGTDPPRRRRYPEIVCATTFVRDRFNAPASTFVVAAPQAWLNRVVTTSPTVVRSLCQRTMTTTTRSACERGTSMRVTIRVTISTRFRVSAHTRIITET